MSDRDDDQALYAYRDDLARGLAILEARLVELGDIAARRDALAAELARVRAVLNARATVKARLRLAAVPAPSACCKRGGSPETRKLRTATVS